jgi:hypothetical protein
MLAMMPIRAVAMIHHFRCHKMTGISEKKFPPFEVSSKDESNDICSIIFACRSLE